MSQSCAGGPAGTVTDQAGSTVSLCLERRDADLFTRCQGCRWYEDGIDAIYGRAPGLFAVHYKQIAPALPVKQYTAPQ